MGTMCQSQTKVLKDPLMMSVTFFTFVFILVISLAYVSLGRSLQKERELSREVERQERLPIALTLNVSILTRRFNPTWTFLRKRWHRLRLINVIQLTKRRR